MSTTSSTQRRVLDLVVQSATVDLFQAYGVAAAPNPPMPIQRTALPATSVCASIRFTSKPLRGVLFLCLPRQTLKRTTTTLPSAPDDRDWIRELANQLIGRIKNKLVRYQVELMLGVPSALDESAATRSLTQAEPRLTYVFRVLHGEMLIWLSGEFDATSLVFSTATEIVDEGTTRLF